MALTGVVDAAVGGGVAKYQEAFLTEAFTKAHPENADLIARLKVLTQDFFFIFHFYFYLSFEFYSLTYIY
jgi:hypothetical protein